MQFDNIISQIYDLASQDGIIIRRGTQKYFVSQPDIPHLSERALAIQIYLKIKELNLNSFYVSRIERDSQFKQTNAPDTRPLLIHLESIR